MKSFSHNHIDVLVGESDDQKRWRFTGFYNAPEVSERYESWDLLRRLKDDSMLSWLCVGDFNEIMDSEEKLGGVQRQLGKWKIFKR